jgi:hypothetical protein
MNWMETRWKHAVCDGVPAQFRKNRLWPVFDQIGEVEAMHPVDTKEQDMLNGISPRRRVIPVKELRFCPDWNQERYHAC